MIIFLQQIIKLLCCLLHSFQLALKSVRGIEYPSTRANQHYSWNVTFLGSLWNAPNVQWSFFALIIQNLNTIQPCMHTENGSDYSFLTVICLPQESHLHMYSSVFNKGLSGDHVKISGVFPLLKQVLQLQYSDLPTPAISASQL